MQPNFSKSIVVIGYARVTFPAGVPTYQNALGFDTSIAPIDNGPGDTTLTLDGITAGAATLVNIHVSDPCVASRLRCFGYVFPTANTIRITSLEEQGGGAASALADIAFRVELRALAPTYIGG